MFCTKFRLQCFSGSSVVWSKLLGTFLSSIFLLPKHLIELNFCGITAHRKTKVTTVGLCNDMRIIGRKLIGWVHNGKWWVQDRSLKVQSQITRYILDFFNLLSWQWDQRRSWTWCIWRVLSLSGKWSCRQKISLKVEISLLDWLLNDLERILWIRVWSIRHK